MIIPIDLGDESYNIIFERHCLDKSEKFLNLRRKVLIVSDSGVPQSYVDKIKQKCAEPYCVRIDEGEGSKDFSTFENLCGIMLKNEFTRSDCVVAVGGGVVGDLSGFAAACYMRGIDFYNVATTLLSQVDSSIGGKTAINLNSIKNIVGAFKQPKCVLIDPEVLRSLPKRQLSNGLAESVKMALTSDKKLFELIESSNPFDDDAVLDKIIEKSILIKRDIVQQDEKEQNLRRILNFGHTLGHGIESQNSVNGLYHGECVALGMIPMCNPEIRQRVKNVLKKLNLPTHIEFDVDKVWSAVIHDKKTNKNKITAIFVEQPGECNIENISMDVLKLRLGVLVE